MFSPVIQKSCFCIGEMAHAEEIFGSSLRTVSTQCQRRRSGCDSVPSWAFMTSSSDLLRTALRFLARLITCGRQELRGLLFAGGRRPGGEVGITANKANMASLLSERHLDGGRSSGHTVVWGAPGTTRAN